MVKGVSTAARMKLHEIRCHFHEVSYSIIPIASAASGGAEP
jgi:hypothetical protein